MRRSTVTFCVFLLGLWYLGHIESYKIFEVDIQEYTSLNLSLQLARALTKYKQIPSSASQNYDFKRLFEEAQGCNVCEEVVGDIISLRRSNATRDTMIDYLNQLCAIYTNWGEVGCAGRVNNEVDTYLYIIDHKEDLKAATFCAIRFQQYDCQDPNAANWTIFIPSTISATQKELVAQELDDSETLKILQISDVHINSLYTPGSNAECDEPLCCQSGTPATEDDAAGYWGDYRECDMPWHTLSSMIENIQKTHDNVDYVYFTGDILPHNNWMTSVKGNIEMLTQFYTLLYETFPNKTVFPVFGNHEPHPADFYPPESVDKNSNVSIQWLFDLAAEEWSRWLPDDTQATIKKGGYYTVLVKPGFRIIALNSNVCYVSNIWLAYENDDTYGQLQWLVEILTEAELNGENVHIVAHIPSGDAYSSCTKVWSREFKKIVLRFADTIAAIINGHTHCDEFKLYFEDPNYRQVKIVGYNGASFTTIWGSNSNYRIYEIDSTNLTVTDYSEYIFNLTKANLNLDNSPDWYKLYSFKEAYGLSDLTLDSLGDLYQRMSSNNSDNALVDQYYRYRYRDSDEYNEESCDSDCKQQLVCVISAADTTATLEC